MKKLRIRKGPFVKVTQAVRRGRLVQKDETEAAFPGEVAQGKQHTQASGEEQQQPVRRPRPSRDLSVTDLNPHTFACPIRVLS